ncbi:uncharacterized protein FIESC28_08481 [Fusarium coffeatum]|uniref:SGNH hydrolase-type esterase domain-containing protein n=1 Tax=Fusarium coffeatum TaxID=231269 RepID=A0A366R6K6_9HYPO|nr:uncharacterized protein FIESC28_08481 [Fusarium coffeatum]RBR12779.1 hypothetical protein FIESC28_08481 [Fusarium coffeatum]
MYYLRSVALLSLPASICLGGVANPVANIPPLQVGGDIRRIERDAVSSGSPPSICLGGSCMAVQGGVKLRILGVGASITVGYGPGTDGNGYRKRLQENLGGNEVVWVGTEKNSKSDMAHGYFSGWNGKTIQYINNHIDPALSQRPNLILIFAGTNDMNSNPHISKEGNDPALVASRLKEMVEKMIYKCPDATILLGMIANTCDSKHYHGQRERTKVYRRHIADVAAGLSAKRSKVLAADFGPFEDSWLSDCVHPTHFGYQVMGDWWFDFIRQVPEGWITKPVGPDPVRKS